jgi:hypothetical protein
VGTKVPPAGIPVNAGYREDMHRSRPAAAPLHGAVRSRLILWLAVLVVGLSLLAMHQLSGNHTAAGPASSHQSVTVTVDGSSHHAAGHASETGADHAHLLPITGAGLPASEQGGCPDCAGHSAMALTCLAALILLAARLLLPRPGAGRGILQPRRQPLAVLSHLSRCRPRPLSLVELSVSRT